ncbi:MAG: metalloregulator ArsR/SmtB family transcription factor [Rhizobiaceae bacterium]
MATQNTLQSVAKDETAVSAKMMQNAEKTTDYLKSLSHPVRLIILCRLAEGDANVSELENLVGVPQAAVSKQLARLREDKLVRVKREGRTMIYSLTGESTRTVIRTLYNEFCLI